ncbi:UNVERIFIED_CONTAM: hypothetical protein FKN15_036114 [Acipenser sinensis]
MLAMLPFKSDFHCKQKLKEEREAKRAQLDSRHDYVLGIVASCVGLEKGEIEDAILEGTQVSMVDAIPGLINAIRMIHSISRYYNTSEKITSLFVKVTNQMITACKAYISNHGAVTIWDQPQTIVADKLKAAIRLNEEYQRCFHKTKQKLEQNASERQFDFSEMYIFGKFDTFQRRLTKILNMFNTITTYSALEDSKIEGLEVMATTFQQARGKGGAVSKLMESMAADEDFEPNQDSSFSEDENVPLSALIDRPDTPGPRNCVIDKDELKDGLRVLIPMDDKLLYAGHVQTVHSPDM